MALGGLIAGIAGWDLEALWSAAVGEHLYRRHVVNGVRKRVPTAVAAIWMLLQKRFLALSLLFCFAHDPPNPGNAEIGAKRGQTLPHSLPYAVFCLNVES